MSGKNIVIDLETFVEGLSRESCVQLFRELLLEVSTEDISSAIVDVLHLSQQHDLAELLRGD